MGSVTYAKYKSKAERGNDKYVFDQNDERFQELGSMIVTSSFNFTHLITYNSQHDG